MKKVMFILILIISASCVQMTKPQNPTQIFSVERGDLTVTKIKYEQHDYLIFRGSDYFSAVVHSASCHYCDSIKLMVKN